MSIPEYDKNVNFCRGCMSSKDLRDFSNNLRFMFTTCTSIQISDDVYSSLFVCSKCENDIYYCYKFINRCKQTENELKKIFPYDPKLVKFIKKENFTNHNDDSNCDDNETFPFDAEYISIKKEISVNFIDESENTETFKFDNHSNEIESIKKVKSVKSKGIIRKQISDCGRKKSKIILKDDKKLNIKCYTCPLCHKTFGTKIKFKNHFSIKHNEKKTFVCSLCPKRFSSPKHLDKHKSSHNNEKSSFCNICKKSFKNLKLHHETHADVKPFQCDICSLSFTLETSLKRHRKAHDDSDSFLCDLCGTDFTQKGNLKVHMRIHTGEKPYSCSKCTFRCSVKSGLRRHELQHGDVCPHVCNVCQKSFRSGSSLIRHKRIHSGELPYQCTYCSKAFIDSWKRKIHLVKIHNISLTDIPRMSLGRKRKTSSKIDNTLQKKQNQNV